MGGGLKTWAREVLIQRGFSISPFLEQPKPGNSTVSLNPLTPFFGCLLHCSPAPVRLLA